MMTAPQPPRALRAASATPGAARIARRLTAPGAKRILAIDGGGTRGIVAIRFLAEIERTLQAKLGRGDDFVLSDYFDLVGGTSVGALIATLVARGWRVADIEACFARLAREIFKSNTRGLVAFTERRMGYRPDWLVTAREFVRLVVLSRDRYNAAALERILADIVGDEPMASDRLATGLAVICKRADTNSVWTITNNPNAPYFDDQASRDGSGGITIGNGFYKLADVLRASTAAPTYFRPVEIEIHDAGDGAVVKAAPGSFIDGGVSPHNNPALKLLLMAALPNYRLGGLDDDGRGRSWPLGPENLLIVSVGTGAFELPVPRGRWTHLGLKASAALQGIVKDSEQMALGVLQALSDPRLPWRVDSVMKDLKGVTINGSEALAFQRYDLPLDAKWLIEGDPRGGIADGGAMRVARLRYPGDLARDVAALQRIDAPDMIARLGAIAGAAARDQVCASHFPEAFDRVWVDEGAAACDPGLAGAA